MTPEAAQAQAVDFHFDPLCPWAYQTSRWIREVRDRAGLEVRWRFFSLEEINRPEGKPHPWERDWAWGFSLMRIAARLRREDPARCDTWYLSVGRALHVEGRPAHRREVAAEVLTEMGVERSLLDEAIADPTTIDEVRADHDAAVALGAFGVPTLVFDDRSCVFGPVILAPPEGEAALDLWQLVLRFRAAGDLFELQRPKTPTDLARIAQRFRPYLEAREWQTIQRKAP